MGELSADELPLAAEPIDEVESRRLDAPGPEAAADAAAAGEGGTKAAAADESAAAVKSAAAAM